MMDFVFLSFAYLTHHRRGDFRERMVIARDVNAWHVVPLFVCDRVVPIYRNALMDTFQPFWLKL